MIRTLPLLAVLSALAFTSVSAVAAPVGIDGVLGGEWAGVPAVTVTHDAAAPTGNFGAPSTTTAGASYTIQVRDDGAYYYVGLQVSGDAASSAGNFANLYFDTNPAAADGSDVGFEVTNNRFFIPGVSGYFDASPFLTYDAGNSGTIELAIANSFFTSSALGFPAATGDVVLRLSQSFGYSVGGGPEYGVTRLGSASVEDGGAAATVPEPGSAALLGLGLMGFAASRRKSRK